MTATLTKKKMYNQKKTQLAIDRRIEERQGHNFRNHLGASLIGAECVRQIWYSWRWSKKLAHKARMLRLWNRGHREEERIIGWLRDSGTVVYDTDPNTGKQIRIEDFGGHFGGSVDSILFDAPDFPGLYILGEYKTHADKYFKALVKSLEKYGDQEGVRREVPKYYAQAQVYMHYLQLPHALHFNVNKNDDDMRIVALNYDRTAAENYRSRALHVIQCSTPPERISNDPSWYKCGWCEYKHICHEGAPKATTCRTCVHAQPVEGAKWICTKFGNYELSEADQRRGCEAHTMIPE